MRRLIAFLAIAIVQTFAAEAALPDDFNEIFTRTCIKHFNSRDQLQKAMQEHGAEQISPIPARAFLAGGQGTAWLIVAPSTRYVVAHRDDDMCLVFARGADQERVQSKFSSLVKAAPRPMIAKSEDPTDFAPEANHTRTTAYSWSRPADKDRLLFVLTTTSKTDVTSQAIAYITLDKKAD
jgi:hypothetical protein